MVAPHPDAAPNPSPTTGFPLGSLVRVALGLYFAVTLARLVPYADALWGPQGMLPDPALNPPAARLPASLYAWAQGVGPTLLPLVGVGLGLLLALERVPRLAAVGLWAVQALLWHRNVLTLNPTLPINGFLLWATVLLPAARPGHTPLPADLRRVLWIVAAAAYTWSGLTKLAAPSWRSGEALGLILTGPLARDLPWVDALAGAPALTLGLTWGTLALEVGFGPLSLSRRLRPWVLAATTGLHLGILATVQFAELTLGMLPLHLALTRPEAWTALRARWRSRDRAGLAALAARRA